MSALTRAVRSLDLRLRDLADALLGRRDRLTPPRRLQDAVGSGAYRQTGEAFLRHFTELGDLRPSERVLDVGCGSGRMARPLVAYLGRDGSYQGFDVMPAAVEWCREHITPRHPNFQFQLADVRSATYNPSGSQPPGSYSFPFDDAQFDFGFATSVFTHLLEEGADRYLAESARVLQRGGRLLATWFLLNPEALELGRRGAAALDFVAGGSGPTATLSKGPPDAAVAYDEDWVRSRYAHHGLRLSEPIHYGSWSGRERHRDFQDIVIASRP